MKTQFLEGSFLTPTYVQSMYGSGQTGGHRHDAVDSDGHSDRVILTNGSEVQGSLPTLMVAEHVHDATTARSEGHEMLVYEPRFTNITSSSTLYPASTDTTVMGKIDGNYAHVEAMWVAGGTTSTYTLVLPTDYSCSDRYLPVADVNRPFYMIGGISYSPGNAAAANIWSVGLHLISHNHMQIICLDAAPTAGDRVCLKFDYETA